MQTTIADTSAETRAESIRNFIGRRSASGANKTEIVAFCTICRRDKLRDVLEILDAMEQDGDITRTATGTYVVGSHKAQDAQELELVSNDADFRLPEVCSDRHK